MVQAQAGFEQLVPYYLKVAIATCREDTRISYSFKAVTRPMTGTFQIRYSFIKCIAEQGPW